MNRLANIVDDFPEKRIVVIGDVIADQFIYGEISRVSREAPVFILRHEHTETTPGGAGNCAANLAALGVQVALVSVLGNDETGQILLSKLRDAGVDCSAVVLSDRRRTTTKVRVLAGQIHSTRQQVIRIDYDNGPALSADHVEALRVNVTKAAAGADALIISDYNYGVADPEMGSWVRAAAGKDVPVMVDSRFRLASFPDFTSATPNEDEVAALLGAEPVGNAAWESAAEQLRQRLGYKALLMTRGGNGMLLLQADNVPVHIDAIGSRQPVDVTGAGDTVIATYTLALAAGASFAEAARLANFAGGIAVMKRGTATVTTEELVSAALGNLSA
jgi:D-glycero-beta-D-manno-heptose-7-phosphate kinase